MDKINKGELHEAIAEAARRCAVRIIDAAKDEVLVNSGRYGTAKERGLNGMKRLAELAGHVAGKVECELSLSEVIFEATVV